VLEAYSCPAETSQITGSFNNVDTEPLNFTESDVFISAQPAEMTIEKPILLPQQSASVIIAALSNTYTVGAVYTLKIVLTGGAPFTYPIIYGGSG
jgi:hypothetical protein